TLPQFHTPRKSDQKFLIFFVFIFSILRVFSRLSGVMKHVIEKSKFRTNFDPPKKRTSRHGLTRVTG
ncbi:hypothetical protein, partial [Gluconobacter oxydans]|uniref:hypothetical protein n=1 Tax=Gluconobacter oxydans TaxID=442 RepID=UPI001E302C67